MDQSCSHKYVYGLSTSYQTYDRNLKFSIPRRTSLAAEFTTPGQILPVPFIVVSFRSVWCVYYRGVKQISGLAVLATYTILSFSYAHS